MHSYINIKYTCKKRTNIYQDACKGTCNQIYTHIHAYMHAYFETYRKTGRQTHRQGGVFTDRCIHRGYTLFAVAVVVVIVIVQSHAPEGVDVAGGGAQLLQGGRLKLLSPRVLLLQILHA